MLEGGHAVNALPQLATAKVNCRIMPGEPVDGVKATLERVLADDQITVTQIDQAVLSAPSALHEEIMARSRNYRANSGRPPWCCRP